MRLLIYPHYFLLLMVLLYFMSSSVYSKVLELKVHYMIWYRAHWHSQLALFQLILCFWSQPDTFKFFSDRMIYIWCSSQYSWKDVVFEIEWKYTPLISWALIFSQDLLTIKLIVSNQSYPLKYLDIYLDLY